MKNHKQMCGLAVALDFIGDRWTLLIVRELLVGPKRFSDIQASLPGCSPNLLTARLHDMKQKGLIEESARSGRAGFYNQLTKEGLSLRNSVESLIQWGGQFIPMQKGLVEKQPHWLEVAAPALLKVRWKKHRNLKIQFEIDGYHFGVEAKEDHIIPTSGLTSKPNVTLKLSYNRALAILSGYAPIKSLVASEIPISDIAERKRAIRILQEALGEVS